MSLGTVVRERFGPLEPTVARLYRRLFFDPKALCRAISVVASPSRILEVGCGEGLLTEELLHAFPCAHAHGIDITPRVGRLFRGDPARVGFSCDRVESFTARHAGVYDLVVVSDVLHHVPPPARKAFLADTRRALANEGVLVIKDWARLFNLPHLFGWLSDRAITQDAVSYLTEVELRGLVQTSLPELRLISAAELPPWRNNVALLLTARAP